LCSDCLLAVANGAVPEEQLDDGERHGDEESDEVPGRALTASSTAADWMIAGRKNARLSSFYLFSLFASGPCRLRVQRRCPMSRAMIASAYIRQLRSGLPLCCMHGQSRR
jgi:hypothetical protein